MVSLFHALMRAAQHRKAIPAMRQPDAQRSIESYRRLAKSYDASCIPVMPIREEAVALLNLRSGDVAVDVASGTGLSFPLLMKAIGPTGHLIAIERSSRGAICSRIYPSWRFVVACSIPDAWHTDGSARHPRRIEREGVLQ